MERISVVYRGKIYRRNPKAKQRAHRVYYWCHDKYREPPHSLHRDMWITSVPEAFLRAQAQIAQFGHAVYDLKVTTLVPGCRIGQQIMANVPSMGITNYPLVIKRIEATVFVPGTNGQLQYQIECIGSDTVTFTDLMTTLLQQEAVQSSPDSSTVSENLVEQEESLTLTETVTITATVGFYKYGPTSPQARYGFATYA
jgi:hypothetical protein